MLKGLELSSACRLRIGLLPVMAYPRPETQDPRPKTQDPHVRAGLQLSNQALRRPPVQPRGKTWCCSPGVVQGKVQGPGPNVVSEARWGTQRTIPKPPNLKHGSFQGPKAKAKALGHTTATAWSNLLWPAPLALSVQWAMGNGQCATFNGSMSASCCRHRVAVTFLP